MKVFFLSRPLLLIRDPSVTALTPWAGSPPRRPRLCTAGLLIVDGTDADKSHPDWANAAMVYHLP